MGAKNAPAIFQITLDNILRQFIGKFCFVYIDDIIIFSKDEESHLANLQSIFETLNTANMKIKLQKCDFFKREVKFLGFVIREAGIKSNQYEVKPINDFPMPKTVKNLRSFLDL